MRVPLNISVRKSEQESYVSLFFWVVIRSETEVHRGYSIIVVCKAFLHRNASISVFLEEVILRDENLLPSGPGKC